jgi:hypothetical protein
MKPPRGRVRRWPGLFGAVVLSASCTYSVGNVKPPDGGAPNDASTAYYADLVMAAQPVAYYRLNETSGSVARDSSGHGNDGAYGKNVVLGTPGLLARDRDLAAMFPGGSGVDNVVIVPKNALLEPTQAVTVECWVKLSVVPTDPHVFFEFVSYGQNDRPPYQPYVLQLQTGLAQFYAENGPAAEGTSVVKQGLAYHLVGLFDSAAPTRVRVWVNGKEDGRADSPLVSLVYTVADQGLSIGGTIKGAGTVIGVLDDVAVYRTALDATTIAAHYAAGSSP